MNRMIQRWRAFFKRYGLLRGLIIMGLTPAIKLALMGWRDEAEGGTWKR